MLACPSSSQLRQGCSNPIRSVVIGSSPDVGPTGYRMRRKLDRTPPTPTPVLRARLAGRAAWPKEVQGERRDSQEPWEGWNVRQKKVFPLFLGIQGAQSRSSHEFLVSADAGQPRWS